MADILALVLHHDESKVEQAIQLALNSEGVSKPNVINCLTRLLQPERPEPIHPPDRLRLVDEPIADTTRYDHLREKRHVR
jgi:hypothetical protein